MIFHGLAFVLTLISDQKIHLPWQPCKIDVDINTTSEAPRSVLETAGVPVTGGPPIVTSLYINIRRHRSFDLPP